MTNCRGLDKTQQDTRTGGSACTDRGGGWREKGRSLCGRQATRRRVRPVYTELRRRVQTKHQVLWDVTPVPRQKQGPAPDNTKELAPRNIKHHVPTLAIRNAQRQKYTACRKPTQTHREDENKTSAGPQAATRYACTCVRGEPYVVIAVGEPPSRDRRLAAGLMPT